MADFEAWAPPFDFKTADGGRDHQKHKSLLNFLLDLVIEHVDGYSGDGGQAFHLKADSDSGRSRTAFR